MPFDTERCAFLDRRDFGQHDIAVSEIGYREVPIDFFLDEELLTQIDHFPSELRACLPQTKDEPTEGQNEDEEYAEHPGQASGLEAIDEGREHVGEQKGEDEGQQDTADLEQKPERDPEKADSYEDLELPADYGRISLFHRL